MRNVTVPYKELSPLCTPLRARILDLEASGLNGSEVFTQLHSEGAFTVAPSSATKHMREGISAIRGTVLDSPDIADAAAAATVRTSHEKSWMSVLKYATVENVPLTKGLELDSAHDRTLLLCATLANRHLPVARQEQALRSGTSFGRRFLLDNPSVQIFWGENKRIWWGLTDIPPEEPNSLLSLLTLSP